MEQSKKRSKTDITVSIILIIYCTLTIIYSLTFPKSERSVGVATFPRILCGIIIALSLLQILFVKLRNNGGVVSPFRIPKKTLKLIGISIGLIFVYILVIQLLGFLLSTILLLAALVVLFGERSPLKTTIVSISVTTAIYLIFHVLARVPFPNGIIEILFNLS